MTHRNHIHGSQNGGHKNSQPLCGIVLAGGEGKRLRSFVYLLRGDLLPKQFVSFIGTRSMLTHTFQRAEMLIPRRLLYTVINREHLSFPEVHQQLADRPEGTVIMQPENKGSGAGLLLSLLHLHKHHANSTVAVFPADQFAMDDGDLMRHVRLASAIVNKQPTKLVVLGIPPDTDDSGYSYIVPRDRTRSDGWGSYEVSRLVEKPSPAAVGDLLRRGALWNTGILVFNSATVLALIQDLLPELARSWRTIERVLGTVNEEHTLRQVYAQLAPINCATDLLDPILRHHPRSVLSLPVEGVLWSDWGTETRVLNILRRSEKAKRLNGLPLLSRHTPVQATAPEIAIKSRGAAPHEMRRSMA